MVSSFDTRFLKSGPERPLSPAVARKRVLDEAVGTATVSMAALDVLNQPLYPVLGAHVEEAFEERRSQQQGVPYVPISSEVAAPAVDEASQEDYITAITEDSSESAHLADVIPLSPRASGLVIRAAFAAFDRIAG